MKQKGIAIEIVENLNKVKQLAATSINPSLSYDEENKILSVRSNEENIFIAYNEETSILEILEDNNYRAYDINNTVISHDKNLGNKRFITQRQQEEISESIEKVLVKL